MAPLPTGTVTFLFTAIEDSTRVWEQSPEAGQQTIEQHTTLSRQVISAHSGVVVKFLSDGCLAVFAQAAHAVAAAVALQQTLQAVDWAAGQAMRVAIALHTGVAQERDRDYFGPTLNRAARLLAAGYGGQILLSQVTLEHVHDQLPPTVMLRDLGERLLKDLTYPERIFQLIIPGLPNDFPPLKTLDMRPTNLPVQSTALIGRDQELAEATALLKRSDVRLLSLTGPGGIGKTRLGLQIAAEALDDFEHGVMFVPLESISNPAMLASAIATTLGVKEIASEPLLVTLKEYLQQRNLLLMLDNFEQVVTGGPVVMELLNSAPRIKALITTREVLQVYGEHEYPVSALALPSADQPITLDVLNNYAAVALFLAHAQLVKPDFVVTVEHAAAIIEICQRLDGLPLAIELAAARIRLLSPKMLLSRLSSRLKTLTVGARDLPLRQQTLRGAIDWSFDLLEPAEQSLFARMAAFTGGCSLEAIEAVCNQAGDLDLDVLDGVSSLINKSLVRQEEVQGGEPRLWMLETIREYAMERLAGLPEAATIHRQHAEFFATLAEQSEAHLRGTDQARWLTRLEYEHYNFRSALQYADQHHDGSLLVRLSGGLWRFWSMHGHLSEGASWLIKAIQQGSAAPTANRAMVFHGAGFLAWLQGDYDRARQHFTSGLELRRACGDTTGSAILLNNLGHLAIVSGDDAGATILLEEALSLQRSSNELWGRAFSILNLGNVALRQEQYDRAATLYEESLSIRRSLNDQRGIGGSLHNLGWVRLAQSKLDQALECFTEALQIADQQSNKISMAECLTGLASVAYGQQQLARAITLWAAAEALGTSLGARLCPDIGPIFVRHQATMQTLVAEPEFAAAATTGRALSSAETVALALDQA